MTPKKKAPSILGRAMLANVSIGFWAARKHDRKVTEKINEEMARNPHAGRYHKRLFGGEATIHSKVITAVGAAREAHRHQTLPWTDDGWRLLPSENYFEYTKVIRQFKARFEECVEAFLADYPKLVEEAKKLLRGMYRREDYPPVDEVRRKFHFAIEFTPVPAGEDFRLSLPQADMKAMTRGIEDRVHRGVTEAMQEAWARLGEAVHELRGRLDDGKYLRDTMIDRVREVAEILGRLNFANDPALDKARKQVLKDLCVADADTLKDDDKVRNATAKAADDILKSMQGVYSPPPPEPKKKAPAKRKSAKAKK
jgi:hypothetical protein